MTISIWRYSHLTLALVSGLFLVLASVTGIILAFEPMQSAMKPYQAADLSEINLAETIGVLQNEYDEVLSIEVDANDFVLADVVMKTGESGRFYVHPKSGTILGKPQPQHPIFQFATNLHRSLFLKGIGRFFVGFVSLLLCFIALTGFLLIIKRQGGILKLFSKVQKDYAALQYHVVLGRWFLIPILIVAATGVYLSAEKFSLLPSTQVRHELGGIDANVDMSIRPNDLDIFKDVTLDEVRSVAFPFSEFPEDYFELALREKELYVHQYTGQILSEQNYPFTFLASQWSMLLHTGQGSILWSMVLLLVSIALLFFICSGFVMWRKRIKNAKIIGGTLDKDECSHIILVGSETGTTYAFAQALEKGLTSAGKTVLVSQMNDYTSYDRAEHLIFLTATYGEGEAPTNARHLESLLKTNPPKNPVHYSVVGFGSLTYPDYCQFAIDVDKILGELPNFKNSLPLYKINNQSFDAFKDWAKRWGEATATTLQIQPLEKKFKKAKSRPFEVMKKTDLNIDDTFIIHLKPKKKVNFQSGDLWEYIPEDGIPRWYSIAKYQNHIVLSIKRHQQGKVSTRLANGDCQSLLQGGIRRNTDFHFPKGAPEIVCISNGTGIAPFLGIIDENVKGIPIELYWGGRRRESLSLYHPYLKQAQSTDKLSHIHLALSQENQDKAYVQDLLKRDSEILAKKMDKGTVFMICGSMAMQNAVLEVLEGLSQELLGKPLSEFEHQEQLKMDCY